MKITYKLYSEENISKWILKKYVLSRTWINHLGFGCGATFVCLAHDTKLRTFVRRETLDQNSKHSSYIKDIFAPNQDDGFE